MNYEETLIYLDSLRTNYRAPRPRRMGLLLKELGNPERSFRKIHIAGTNGKGSVATMITNILLASDLRVGKFTAPFLLKVNEDIEFNGQDISDEDFTRLVNIVKTAHDKLVEKGCFKGMKPFEIVFAAAMLYFKEQHTNYAIIEAGIGGLLDPTNIIRPNLSVITNVDLDHTKLLGDTVELIAEQKAGIIKKDIPVITAAETENALNPILKAAKECNSDVYVYGKDFKAERIESSLTGQKLSFSFGHEPASLYDINLAGDHQIQNSAVALSAIHVLRKHDKRIRDTALYDGLNNTFWPGRLEKIDTHPDLILDGGHNPHAVKALRKALDMYYPHKRIVFIFGIMKDKDIKGVVNELLNPDDFVYAVKAAESTRSAAAGDIAAIIGKQAVCAADLKNAFRQALLNTGYDGVIVVCGSFHLVGNFKKMLKEGYGFNL